MKRKDTGKKALKLPFVSWRRAVRAVTALYDREFRAGGLRVTQYTLLLTLATIGAIAQGHLGRLLAIDSTTLTRRLALLARLGFVTAAAGPGRRNRLWRLTGAGHREITRLHPYWERAQNRLKQALGNQDWITLQTILDRVTRAAVEA